MDQYSHPLKIEKKDLCVLYYLKPRKRWAGRELVVSYDERFPLIENFINRYSYLVRFFEKGNCAGNHYHLHKDEFMLPLEGKFEIFLEDIKTKKKERFLIDSKDNIAFYVTSGLAHAVKLMDENGLLLVTASGAGQEADIFPYQISK